MEKTLVRVEEGLGPEHSDTLETINFMGYLFQGTGDLERALS